MSDDTLESNMRGDEIDILAPVRAGDQSSRKTMVRLLSFYAAIRRNEFAPPLGPAPVVRTCGATTMPYTMDGIAACHDEWALGSP